MTGLLEAPVAASADPEPMDAAPRGAGWSQLRVELRLARRQAARAWASSLLVVTLVALPMALLVGGSVFAFSRLPTGEQRVTTELGQAEAWLSAVSGPDPSAQQSPEQPWNYWVDTDAEGMPVNPQLPPIDDITPLLPAGVEVIELVGGTVTARTPGGIGTFTATVGDAWRPVLDGRFEFVDGRVPANDREAMVSPGTLARLDAELGDTLTLTEPRATFTIVGTMKEATSPSSTQAVFLPRTTAVIEGEGRTWFTPDWQPAAAELPALNRQGVIAYARDLVDSDAFDIDAGSLWYLVAAVSAVAVFCAYLVVLLAGAAFAVSTRRQQRSLAVAASVGAPNGSVFRIVLLQGTVLGLVGGVVGAAIGIGLAAVALPLFDDGSATSYWGFNIPWALVVGIVAFAVAVGTASALFPARAATKGDVLSALRGARKPVSVRASRPLWGTLLIAVGLGATLLGGLTLAGLNAAEIIDYSSPARTLSTIGIIAGPILFQVGVVLAGHWILSLLARAGSYLGLAPRIATRDAAAHPSRIVPAFGAIAACVFIASFALSAVAISMAGSARGWWYSSPLGTVHVDIWTEASHADRMEEQALSAARQANPDRTAVVRGGATYFTNDPATGEVVDAEAWATLFTPQLVTYVDCADIGYGECTDAGGAAFNEWLYVVDPGELETALGTPVSAAALRAFADGGAIVTDPDFVADGAVTINAWDRDFVDTYWQNYDPHPALDPKGTWVLPAEAVELPHRLPWRVLISPETAAEIGMLTVPMQVIGAFDTPPTQEGLDRIAQTVGQAWTSAGGMGYAFESGPPDPAPWLWLILGAVSVLVLGAAGVVLGLARFERRPDDATLTAVGAPRRLRRGIAFWQGLIIVGVGAVTGTLAGIIPMWGIVLQSQNTLSLADTPWPWLAGLAIGLPVAIAVANWLVPPRHPDLTRRTAIA